MSRARDTANYEDKFASGTKMIFNQTAAPTGWTKVTSANDVALRLTSGTVGTGGSVAFETAFASQTVPVHTLVKSEIPAHGHDHAYGPGAYSGHNYTEPAADNGSNAVTSPEYATGQKQGVIGSPSSEMGGNSHGHGSIDLNVSYVDVIIATKD